MFYVLYPFATYLLAVLRVYSTQCEAQVEMSKYLMTSFILYGIICEWNIYI
jgi:hypothetical protein